MGSVNYYVPKIMSTTASSGGCDGSAFSEDAATNHSQFTWHSGWDREVDSRARPADLISNMTSQENAWHHVRTAGVGPWVHYGHSHDYSCYSWGNWNASIKKYKREVFYPSFDPTMALTWPSWSTALRLAIKDEVINLGATLAEYRQSVRMFGSAAKGVVDAFRSIRKLKFMKKRSLCSVTNAHLIHDYGIAPLMSDMYDSWEALRLRLEQPIYRKIYMGMYPDTVVKERNLSWTTRGGYVETYESVRGKQKVNAYVELDREKASMFTIGNPLEIAWEVIPFSFAIDWFIPIGDTLIALDALKAVKKTHVVMSRKEEEKGRYLLFDKDMYGAVHPGGTPGEWHKQSHQRWYMDHIPLPSFPKPAWNSSVSTLFNAISLLVSVRGCKGVMPRWKKSDLRP